MLHLERIAKLAWFMHSNSLHNNNHRHCPTSLRSAPRSLCLNSWTSVRNIFRTGYTRLQKLDPNHRKLWQSFPSSISYSLNHCNSNQTSKTINFVNSYNGGEEQFQIICLPMDFQILMQSLQNFAFWILDCAE
jgi:hypothetical protein